MRTVPATPARVDVRHSIRLQRHCHPVRSSWYEISHARLRFLPVHTAARPHKPVPHSPPAPSVATSADSFALHEAIRRLELLVASLTDELHRLKVDIRASPPIPGDAGFDRPER